MNGERILICICSDANFLSLNLLEILLSKNCYILIVTNEIDKWEKVVMHVAAKSHFSFIKPGDIKKPLTFNYIIFSSGFIDKYSAYKEFKLFSENKYLRASKILTIFPFEIFNAKDDALIGTDDRLGTIYLGDVVGQRMNMESNLLAPRLVRSSLEKGEMEIATGEVFYPIFIADAAKTIAKWIFSFGPYGKSLFFLGTQVSASEFWNENKKIVGDLKLKYNNKLDTRFVPRNHDIKHIPINLSLSLADTYRWINTNPTYLSTKTHPRPKKIRKPMSKRLKIAITSVVSILILPLFLNLISLGLSYFSYRDILSGRENYATPKLHIAKVLFRAANGESSILKHIPGLGLFYKELSFVSALGAETAQTGINAIPLIRNGSKLLENILGDPVYDPSSIAQELSSGLSVLAQNLAKIETITYKADTEGSFGARLMLQKYDPEKIKRIAEQSKNFSENLPSFLGSGQRKTYLVLFQNNMELRPTGGFIGSFGLLTLDGGRMTELTVNDVYSADGQLKGHVEPPEPIKNYLGEANWWLRDSNWDPDFPTSAKRAEWFLDKEIDQKVDGVFAIDLNLVKDILKLTGPVFLADYNLNITSENIYEKTQAEVEEEFFPGSHQKASFLTALSKNLISIVENLEEKKKILLLASIFKNFEERHIQAYLHEETLQSSISEIGWGGGVSSPTCGAGCYADLVGITEANVGVNKANYFVNRKVDLNVTASPQSIERQLILEIKNSANNDLGPRGRYKVYVRVFIPDDSVLTSVRSLSGEYSEELKAEISQVHGRFEVGVLAEVLGESSKKIVFDWRTKPEAELNLNKYGVYVRKQGGVGDDLWTINISPSSPGLTKEGLYTYNTVLSKDFFARVNLK